MYNFSKIYSNALKLLEFCKDMKKITDSNLRTKTIFKVLQDAKYLTKKGDKYFLKNSYLIAIEYWKESINIHKFILRECSIPSEKERLVYSLLYLENKIIFAFLIRSEKYCLLAKEAIENGNLQQTKKDLTISIDSYQNALAELKKFKLFFQEKNRQIPLRGSDSALNKFNIFFLPQGIKIVLFNTVIILKSSFSLEEEELPLSIGLCYASIKKLKEHLNSLESSVNYKLLNYN